MREDTADVHNRIQHFGFIFPLALVSLKEILQGSLDMNTSLKTQVDDLWGEFKLLADAVASPPQALLDSS